YRIAALINHRSWNRHEVRTDTNDVVLIDFVTRALCSGSGTAAWSGWIVHRAWRRFGSFGVPLSSRLAACGKGRTNTTEAGDDDENPNAVQPACAISCR